jgi:hypothetical protein
VVFGVQVGSDLSHQAVERPPPVGCLELTDRNAVSIS